MSSVSSQFLKAARWSSPQNLERAFSVGKSTSVSVKPRFFHSSARRLAYCTKWNRKALEFCCCCTVRMFRLAGGGMRPSASATR